MQGHAGVKEEESVEFYNSKLGGFLNVKLCCRERIQNWYRREKEKKKSWFLYIMYIEEKKNESFQGQKKNNNLVFLVREFSLRISKTPPSIHVAPYYIRSVVTGLSISSFALINVWHFRAFQP